MYPPATFGEFATTIRAVVAVIIVIGIPIYNALHPTLGGSHLTSVDIISGIFFGTFFGGVFARFVLLSGTLLVWLWWLLFIEKGTA